MGWRTVGHTSLLIRLLHPGSSSWNVLRSEESEEAESAQEGVGYRKVLERSIPNRGLTIP